MEQTIGKQILENRKRLKMTQDQLAEQLGVTAQAVSKWENNQSCPDITMLPKLAEIFGISTDELLGRTSQPVHEGEIVTENTAEEGAPHASKGNWNFQWDSGRKDGVAFAVLVLLVGILTLLDRIYQWDVGFWSILWPSALMIFGVNHLLSHFSFLSLGCGLFGAYFLVSNLGLWKLNIGTNLVFPIIIVLFGISLLVDALRKPKKPKIRITHNGKPVYDRDGNSETKSTFSVDEDEFECSLSFGEAHRVVTLPRLSSGDINCSFGELVVDLSGCEEIAEDCELEANCSFGELVLLVPRKYRVEPNSSTSFASLSFSGHPDPNPVSVIRLDASVSFGSIVIKYI